MITAVRKIGIDAGHRIPDHESKCKNLHGHRYTVEMHISGETNTIGPEKGMVRDFSFMKEYLMQVVDYNCDHGLILSVEDSFLTDCIITPYLDRSPKTTQIKSQQDVLQSIKDNYLTKYGCWRGDSNVGKLFIMTRPPTAENLAALWFDMLQEKISQHINCFLYKVVVYETPNCWAEFIKPKVKVVNK